VLFNGRYVEFIMRFLKVLILGFATLCSTGYAKTFDDLIVDLRVDGQYEVFEINADGTPSPYLTGYIPETKACHLLVNRSVQTPRGLEQRIQIAHEAGHCFALRRGLQSIGGGATRYGEAFGDVFALAWISSTEPENLQEAVQYLVDHRALDRQLDPAYNTILMILRARTQLPTTKDPVQFTIDLLGPTR
jgi:hypothetical protein